MPASLEFDYDISQQFSRNITSNQILSTLYCCLLCFYAFGILMAYAIDNERSDTYWGKHD